MNTLVQKSTICLNSNKVIGLEGENDIKSKDKCIFIVTTFNLTFQSKS